jgi:putative FmdB family regulatory protein
MPTYTYRCQKCGNEFERFQSMSDEPVKRCPACKGKVQRTFHPAGIVLKGSGFYKTDHRSSSAKPPSTSETKPDTKPETKSEPKGESKGEPKSSESKAADKGSSGSADGKS